MTPVAVTGYVTLYELTECHDAGFEDYFIKPVNLEDLLLVAGYSFKRLERWRDR